MLEKVDLNKKLSKKEYKEVIDKLRFKLAHLQREAKDLKIPVIVVFEGWDAAGKGSLINRMILPLDPRGFTVHPTNPPSREEALRPFLWRFWTKIPSEGKFAIFDRSWYGRVLVERVDDLVAKEQWQRAYDEIGQFERQLADGGYVLVNFFLHISEKEQKKRFKKIQKNPAIAWKVTKEDWKHHRQYSKYLKAYEDMIQKTNTEYSPWIIIESTNMRFATVKIFTTMINILTKKIALAKEAQSSKEIKIESVIPLEEISTSILDQAELSRTLEREEYRKLLKKYQKQIHELEHKIYVKRIPVIIQFEGWDAAGKGGNIRRLTTSMDPRGYEVIPISAPNDIEKAHHYLWRFWKEIPKAGHITIFDRTWYGRVLVERIEGFCTENEWRRAYREINETEEQFYNFGGVVIKFWLQISKDEQLARFEARQNDPNKQWKITEEDWRNREKWDKYKKAVDEMLFRTSTSYAPWTIIESNSKYFARIKVLKTVIDELEKAV